ALVAVAALTLGSFSAVSASAADNAVLKYKTGESIAASPFSTGTGIAGAANTVALDVATPVDSKRRFITISGTGSTAVTATGSTSIATGGTSVLYPDNKTGVLTITTPAVGTITVTVFAETASGSGIFSTTAEETVAVSVIAAAVTNIFSTSTVYGYAGDTSTVTAATSTTDAAFSVTANSAGDASIAQAAMFSVVQKDAAGVALTSGWKVVAVSTTIGSLQTTYDATVGGYVAVTPSSSSAVGFWLVPNGQKGTGTVTVSVNGVTVKTYTVSFYGSLATLTATVVNTQILSSATKTGAVTVVGKDSLGNVVVVTPTITSATAASIASGTCSASTATAASSCDLTAGATAGSSVLTFTSGSITTTATVSAAAKPTAVTLAFDKAEYSAGEAFTVTLTATNAAGVPGDATYSALLAGALTPSQSLTSTLFGASVSLKAGKATATGFMPLASGPLTVKATTGADATTADVSATATATVVSNGIAEAAVDAAAEATDAANAATDAANAAAEAADAATAAAQDAADA
ncbi:hypothetical protein, partial [Polynucleobacter sp.]|uniref:hypothetical protein n=1 Tax=Polynucleobacter sp. TaxID=2029855 RepID=UPI00333F46C3